VNSANVVIVTGGTYGIGRAITVTLAERGYRVVAFGLDQRQAGSRAHKGTEGTRKELARRHVTADLLRADVSKARQVARVVRFTIRKYGRIDALVNNAAIRVKGNVLQTTDEMWDKTLAVNLKGMFLTTRAVLPYMIRQGQGAIVNIASGSGWGKAGRIAYCASKGGVLAFSAALALDHVQDKIRVNVVVPGYTRTGMTEGARTPKSAAGRTLRPQDTANAVAFLLSSEADMISGCLTTVGGPLTLTRVF
jgi:NAD(P)-dependent dehydrogenase (short-subunit alcohol dehydrogenase family)